MIDLQERPLRGFQLIIEKGGVRAILPPAIKVSPKSASERKSGRREMASPTTALEKGTD
jgi:hypothetical protein